MQTAAQSREAAAENMRRDPLIGLPDGVIHHYAKLYAQRGFTPERVTFETFLRIALMLKGGGRVRRW